jgi:predicted phosphate transport protein (TIGR00153 family)
MTAPFVPLMPEARDGGRSARSLLRRLRPIDRRFFPLFDQHMALAVDALRALTALLRDVRDPDGRVREIEALEKRADAVMEDVRNALQRSVFPPFARVQVFALANHVDDILDVCEDAAQSLHLYHVTSVTPEAVRLAELAVDSALKLQLAVTQIATLDTPRATLLLCAEVDQLESQADHLMRAAMSKLFREEPDAHQLVKLKAVYEVLESLTDKCKDVAKDIEAIVLRHA